MVVAILAFVTLASLASFAAEIRVSAAASLTDALKEIAAVYEKKTGDKVLFNFGGSSFLALQIEKGAPADIFFSADKAKMDVLEKNGLIDKSTRKSRLSNSLVIVVAADQAAPIKLPRDMASATVKRIALAETQTVPAGIYAKEFLERQNLWTSIKAKVVPTENVRAALAAVEAGNVDAAIVYRTDAAISRKVKIAYEVPREESPNISYPYAVLLEAKNPDRARAFIRHLESNEADAVFRRMGFIVR